MNGTVAEGGIVDVEAPGLRTLENDEVRELPEENRRHRPAAEVVRLLTPTPEAKAITAGRGRDGRGGDAVSSHAARFAELLQRHPAPEVSEQNAEAYGPAFGRVELQYHGGAAIPEEPEEAAGGILNRETRGTQARPEPRDTHPNRPPTGEEA